MTPLDLTPYERKGFADPNIGARVLDTNLTARRIMRPVHSQAARKAAQTRRGRNV